MRLDVRTTKALDYIKIATNADQKLRFKLSISHEADRGYRLLLDTRTSGGPVKLQRFDLDRRAYGRYLKLENKGRVGSGWGYVREIEAYQSNIEVLAVTTDFATHAKLSADNVTDGIVANNNVWHNGGNTSAYIRFDLGATRTIGHIKLASKSNYQLRYKIQISDAPTSGYFTLFDGRTHGGNAYLEGIELPFRASGRYLKLINKGRFEDGIYNRWGYLVELDLPGY